MSVNIKIGDTKAYLIVFRDSGGDRVDLSGRTFSAQLRRSVNDENALADFDCDSSNAEYGEITLSLTAEQTADLNPGRAVWDIKETYGDVVNTLKTITIQIERSVTR